MNAIRPEKEVNQTKKIILRLFWQILRYYELQFQREFFTLIFTEKYKNDDNVIFAGVCTKQACSLTSGEYGL